MRWLSNWSHREGRRSRERDPRKEIEGERIEGRMEGKGGRRERMEGEGGRGERIEGERYVIMGVEVIEGQGPIN